MARFYAPGTRRRNKTYIVRGYIDGTEFEIRTKATSRTKAEREWLQFVGERAKDSGTVLASTPFRELAEAYKTVMSVSKNTESYIERMNGAYLADHDALFGDLAISAIKELDIWNAAVIAYPDTKNETKNRNGIGVAAAVLHLAAHSEIIPWRKIRRFKEDEPETRRPAVSGLRLLLANCTGEQRDLLIFLIAQGWRISETLTLRKKDVDLQKRTLRVYVNKSKRWKSVKMHPEAFEILANRLSQGDLREHVWTWRTRWGVYKWLKQLRIDLKIYGTEMDFTPHMGRHEWASQQNEEGGSAFDMVYGSTWTSPKSVKRYVTPTEEHGHEIAGRVKLGQFTGKKG